MGGLRGKTGKRENNVIIISKLKEMILKMLCLETIMPVIAKRNLNFVQFLKVIKFEKHIATFNSKRKYQFSNYMTFYDTQGIL